MKIYQIIFGLICSVFLQSQAIGAEIPAQFFRTTLYAGDPDRNWTALWSRGDPSDPGSLGLIRNGDTKYDVTPGVELRLRDSEQFENWHWRGLRCDQIGTWPVVVNGRTKGEITVVKSPKRIQTTLTPGQRVGSISVLPAQGLNGYGCFLTGNLTVSPGATIVGLTIDGNVTGSFDNCVFDSCVFRRGQVGPMLETDRGCLFKDCKFENCTVATCSSGMFLRCVWVGKPALGGHNFCNERGTRLALIDCTFDGTDRGVIARATWGDNSDNLYAGIWFKNIAMTPNGGELICVEGNRSPLGFNRNLMFCLRASACVGSVLFFDGQANDNLLSNVRTPIDICGLAPQRGNIIRDSECDYVRINWNGNKGAVNTLLQDVACIGFKPSARGLASGDPKYFKPGIFTAVVEDGSPEPTTRAVRVTVKGHDPAFMPFWRVVNE